MHSIRTTGAYGGHDAFTRGFAYGGHGRSRMAKVQSLLLQVRRTAAYLIFRIKPSTKPKLNLNPKYPVLNNAEINLSLKPIPKKDSVFDLTYKSNQG